MGLKGNESMPHMTGIAKSRGSRGLPRLFKDFGNVGERL